jgi:hypothetical protein
LPNLHSLFLHVLGKLDTIRFRSLSSIDSVATVGDSLELGTSSVVKFEARMFIIEVSIMEHLIAIA